MTKNNLEYLPSEPDEPIIIQKPESDKNKTEPKKDKKQVSLDAKLKAKKAQLEALNKSIEFNKDDEKTRKQREALKEKVIEEISELEKKMSLPADKKTEIPTTEPLGDSEEERRAKEEELLSKALEEFHREVEIEKEKGVEAVVRGIGVSEGKEETSSEEPFLAEKEKSFYRKMGQIAKEIPKSALRAGWWTTK
ncbi:MAG: hypothetical protein AAB877_03155, partial [Patescibacteria group bacterium]